METPINLTGAHIEVETLPESVWQARRDAHLSELDPVVQAHLDRRSSAQKHPVIDFLFEYYRFRPSALMRWSPGL